MARLVKSKSQRYFSSTKQQPLPSLRSPIGSTLFPPLHTGLSRAIVKTKPVEVKGLQRYTLLRTIGTGAFARVRLAIDKVTTDVVVVKVISKGMVVRRKQLDHVIWERRILEQIHHPFIVKSKEAFQDQFFLYIVLEYVQGGELYSLLAQQGSIPTHDTHVYICEIYSALAYLHSQRIVYRDLKPENLLLTASGHIKLADLGFAKVVEGRTYTVCGTPEYLAPEIINREGYNEACDWWALGVLLHEMVLGKAPFTASNPYELYEKILTETVHFPTNLPQNTRNLIEILLIKDPNKRASELEIRNSAYFEGVIWEDVEKCRLQPNYRPKVKSPYDASCFERYTEGNLPIDVKIHTEMALFEGF